MALTDLAAFRLELGDRDEASLLFDDDEAQHFLDNRPGNVLLAVADACDALARQFSQDFDFEWKGSDTAAGKFSKSQRAAAYTKQAAALRVRAEGGMTAVEITRVDGYSDDLSTRDGAGQASRTGRVRQGYYNPDVPF